jgi:hypothetical protein
MPAIGRSRTVTFRRPRPRPAPHRSGTTPDQPWAPRAANAHRHGRSVRSPTKPSSPTSAVALVPSPLPLPTSEVLPCADVAIRRMAGPLSHQGPAGSPTRVVDPDSLTTRPQRSTRGAVMRAQGRFRRGALRRSRPPRDATDCPNGAPARQVDRAQNARRKSVRVPRGIGRFATAGETVACHEHGTT